MRYILIILLSIVVLSTKAQFTGTDSLRNYNNRYVTTNPATAFTNNRLNTLLRGIIDFIDTARAGGGGAIQLGIDTVFAVNDSTIRYRKNGVFRQFTLKGVYDSRRKVDTIYKSNDTTLTFTVNGNLRTVIIPGGTNLNLATANQTATGNRTHNWDNHWLYLNNIKAFGIYQDQPDANHANNNFKTQITTDSSVDGTPLQLMWGLRNIDDDIIDSVHFELTSKDSATYLHHWGADTSKSVKLSLNGNAPITDIRMDVSSSSKVSAYKFGHVASIEPADSVRLKLQSTSATTKIIGARAESSGIWTPVVIDIPTSGVSSLNNVGTGHRLVATPGGNIKTLVFGYGVNGDSTTNANSITVVADTTETNHLVTTSDLNDAVASAVGSQNIQQVLNIGDTSRRPINFTYSADSTDEQYIWKAFPSNYGVDYGADGGQGEYSAGWHRFNGVNAGGRPNVVINFAQYNTSNGGGRINNNDAAFRFGLETHFTTGGQRLFEFHLPELTLYDGTMLRPSTMYVNKENGKTQFNYYATGGVDYRTVDQKDIFSFGENGSMQLVGRPGTAQFTIYDDSASGFRYSILLNPGGAGVSHKTFGPGHEFDSRVIINNPWSSDPVLDLFDSRTTHGAGNIGLRINVSGTQSKTPIQVEGNTTGAVENIFSNTGSSRNTVRSDTEASYQVFNSNPSDPSNAGYNAAYYSMGAGNGAAAGSLGAYYGNSNLGDIDESSIVMNLVSIPFVLTQNATEKARLSTGGAWLVNRKTVIGSEKLSINGTINALADSLNTPSNVLWMDGNGHIKKAAVPGGGSTYTFSNGLTEAGGNVKLGGVFTEATHISGGPNAYSLQLDSMTNISLFSGLEYISSGIGSVVQLTDSVMTIGATSATDFTSFTFSPTKIKFTAADGAGSAGDVWTNVGSGYGHWAAPSGSWSPTLTADANVDGTPTALHATYTRLGNIVTCYVTVSVDPTANTTQTEVGIPLPVASNFANANDVSGTGSGSVGNGQATFVQVSANTTSDRATLIFQSGSTSASIVTLSFQYTIL